MERSRRPPDKKRKFERTGARVPQFIETWSPLRFFTATVTCLAIVAGLAWLEPWLGLLAVPLVVVGALGLRDVLQEEHTILRNFPVVGRLRFVAESLRPELRQYFVESESEENPLSREKRTIVYSRAKAMLDTQPFGTHRPIYESGYEWIGHSLAPARPEESAARIVIGDERCSAPYDASRFNISAMSFGALSGKAILAMNEGARIGGFYQNTGEGGVSRYHLERGGDLVWQIGTGYFGCRAEDGTFDLDAFDETVASDAIKMIELKLSQGAKPSHGGILPAVKVTEEIAEARGVPVGEVVISPPAHTAFDGPTGLLEFLTMLRERGGGRPVGFKLCIGHPIEVMSIVKAMSETDLLPDFITIDGAEGGTGAAPLEFANSVGMPLDDALVFLDNALRGAGLRDRVRIISAGKLTTGFHVLRQIALGADLCNSARAMMLAVGCIQALKCNTNECPTGVTTQKPRYTRGLVVADKAQRVANFHEKTIESFLELLGAAGFEDPDALRPEHLFRRTSPTEIRHLGQVFPRVGERCLLEGQGPAPYQALWDDARTDRFTPGGGAGEWG